MAEIDYNKKILKYIKDVTMGKRVCGKYERLAVERHLRDLCRSEDDRSYPYVFEEKKAMRALNFSKMLKHYKGEWGGKQMKLEGWQVFILWVVFGWQKKTKGRRFTYADIEVARKNGKTTLASVIALFMMILDGEQSAEVYAAAMDKEQAKICWEGAKHIAQGSPGISELFEYYNASIVQPDSISVFKPLSKDSKNKDGLNPSCGICDERHAWKTNELLDVIKSGMGARKQPLIFSITTAGSNMSLPYFRDLKVLKDILDGVIEQDNQFVMIFELDKDDDWNDESVWCKANPNLGISVKWEYMRGEYLDAKNKQSTYETNFKTKNLNLWVDAPQVWIADEKIQKCNFGTHENALIGEEAYAGFDFASHVDIIALELFFPNVIHHPVLSFFWIPESKLKETTDRVDYRQWEKDGYITTTPGDVIDIDFVVSDLKKILKRYNVKNLSFDPYKAYHGLIQGLIKGGFEDILDEFSQSLANMSEPTKEMQKFIIAEDIDFMNNPILRWMFQNIVVYIDPNENIKLHKGKSINKIDGPVALVNAIGGYMSVEAEKQTKKIYTGHTLRSIKL